MAEKFDRRQLLKVLGTGLVAVGVPSVALGQTLSQEQAQQMAKSIAQSSQGAMAGSTAECPNIYCPQGYCGSYCPVDYCPANYCMQYCPSGFSC